MAETQHPRPFIRPFKPATDAPAIHHICRATLPPPLLPEPAFSIAPYIWARPYTHLYPQNCFILDSGAGIGTTAVGYIVGTPSTKDYITRYRDEYIPTLDAGKFPSPEREGQGRAELEKKWEGELPRALLRTLYTPEELLHEDFPGFVEEYPAHFHIDILPEFQRRGYGKQLMDVFLDRLKRDGAKGVHLVMAKENKNAGMFYQRMEFERWPVVLDGGKSGEMGSHEGGIWLVKKLV